MTCLIEKIHLVDGRDFLLFNPRYTHSVDGQILVGRTVSDDGQPDDQNTVTISPHEIAYTVGMKRNDNYGYDEDPSVVPPSLR